MLAGFPNGRLRLSDRQKIIAGNWKLNGTRASAAALARELVAGLANGPSTGEATVTVVVCPAFVHLRDVGEALVGSSVRLGAQNAADHPGGAYTGEVSASMLAEFGVTHVILGHSERRALYGETDALVAARVEAVQAAGLAPILCVGETLEERDAERVDEVIGRQLDAVTARIGASGLDSLTVAYEPVWAIGTGRTATPEQAQAVHAAIRSRVSSLHSEVAARLPILYGGSMKPDNAAELLSMPDIDGGLIGGASLVAEDFLSIVNSVT